MDLRAAVNELTESIEAPSHVPDADAIRAVLARLAELEAGVVTVEWGVHWPGDGVERVADERVARNGVAGHEATVYGAVLVKRHVSPWIEVAP